MKSRTAAPRYTGPERVAYAMFVSGRPYKGRSSGRMVRQPGPGGWLLVGTESIGKTFTTLEAAAAWGEKHGYKVKLSKPVRNPSAAMAIAMGLAVMAGV